VEKSLAAVVGEKTALWGFALAAYEVGVSTELEYVNALIDIHMRMYTATDSPEAMGVLKVLQAAINARGHDKEVK